MNKIKQWWLAGAAVVVLVTVIGAGAVMAQTPSTSPTASGTPAASGTPGAGMFKSNEDATHEAGETAAQEAAEDSGQGFTHGGRGGHHGSNEDATHEAGESPEREATEDAQAAADKTPSASATQSAN